ncbi:hypothetical protein AU375_02689 [Methylobacterium radiotolerans]|nr:hypothetical protein AU375_02689 [Methylobacterium radiotolerans]
MAQPSIIPVILSVLEPYLDAIEAEWQATPAARRVPTLPHLPDGKVNVRQLVRDLIEREAAEVEAAGPGARVLESHQQHFFTKPELSGPVNIVAKAQGLKPIGSRALSDAEDGAVRRRLAEGRSEAKRQAEGHLEARAQLADMARRNAALEAENASLRNRLQHLQRTGSLLRTDPVR